MNFANLKATLRTSVAPIYYLCGSDFYLVQKSIDLITDAAGVSDRLLDVSRLCDEVTALQIVAECNTVSFTGSRRVVIVRSFNFDLLRSGSALLEYVKRPSDGCVLVLVGDSEDVKSIKVPAGIEVVDCNPLAEDILVKLIANALQVHDKRITADAARLLCSYCSNNYSRIDNEISKLVNYFTNKQVIGADEVNAIVSRTQEYQIYELTNAIVKNDARRSEEIFGVLRASGVDDYAIFGSLIGALRRLYYSLLCKSESGAVAACIKCSPYAVQYARRDNRHLAGKIADIYSRSLVLEYQIKSGKISAGNAIVLCYSIV